MLHPATRKLLLKMVVRYRYRQAFARLSARVYCMTPRLEDRCKAAAIRIARKRLKREIAKWEGARRG